MREDVMANLQFKNRDYFQSCPECSSPISSCSICEMPLNFGSHHGMAHSIPSILLRSHSVGRLDLLV